MNEMTTRQVAEKAFNCEEVLLPESNATNGDAGDNDATEIEYLEEHDPMSEDMDASQQDKNATEDEDDEDDESLSEKKVKADRRPTTVLPKKRKNTAGLSTRTQTPPPESPSQPSSPKTPETLTKAKPIGTAKNTTKENEEAASTSRAAAAKAENQVDEEQCRVCTTKVDLVSLFKKLEDQETIADMLMTICPSVSIALKDFMPQFICNPCLDNVTIAMQLKTQCETTERELRKKLSRSKNKVRRPVGYVTIDATIDSDPPSDEEPNDDVEFKVSEEESVLEDDDSEDSDFSGKKRLSRSGGGRRGRRKQISASAAPRGKKQRSIKREVDELDSEDEGSVGKAKKSKKTTNSETPPTEFPCDECEQVFHRKLSLVLHKKAHSSDRSLINCEICGRQFKIQGAYRTHLQKHKEESQGHPCDKCDEAYASKADLKRHMAEDHDEPGMVYTCKKCQRTFVSATRLEKHISRCPGYPMKQRRTEFEGHVVGQDLFKTVAPLTTTYWSDSFSD